MAESRPHEEEFLEPDEWQSMNALLSLNRRVLSDLDGALRREHGLAVTEFDVLITLFNAEDERIGMSRSQTASSESGGNVPPHHPSRA